MHISGFSHKNICHANMLKHATSPGDEPLLGGEGSRQAAAKVPMIREPWSMLDLAI
jgi:hypothetical protein